MIILEIKEPPEDISFGGSIVYRLRLEAAEYPECRGLAPVGTSAVAHGQTTEVIDARGFQRCRPREVDRREIVDLLLLIPVPECKSVMLSEADFEFG